MHCVSLSRSARRHTSNTSSRNSAPPTPLILAQLHLPPLRTAQILFHPVFPEMRGRVNIALSPLPPRHTDFPLPPILQVRSECETAKPMGNRMRQIIAWRILGWVHTSPQHRTKEPLSAQIPFDQEQKEKLGAHAKFLHSPPQSAISHSSLPWSLIYRLNMCPSTTRSSGSIAQRIQRILNECLMKYRPIAASEIQNN